MTTERKMVTHRELMLGDTVSLEFADGGWQNAKVVKMTATNATVMRPWMSSSDTYPTVGFEMFDLWRDSDKTVRLLDRVA